MGGEPQVSSPAKPEDFAEEGHAPAIPERGRWHRIMEDLDGYFKKGLFILVNIFIVLAAFGLYFSVNSIIDRWIEYQYIPLVQSIYYIAIIALGLYIMKIYILKR